MQPVYFFFKGLRALFRGQKAEKDFVKALCNFAWVSNIWNGHMEFDGVLCNILGNIRGVSRSSDGVPGRLEEAHWSFHKLAEGSH